MKRILATLKIFFTTIIYLSGQAPESVILQSVIKDQNGQAIVNTDISIMICILEGSIEGNLIYREFHQPKTNEYGLVVLHIGEGTAVEASFDAIDWNGGPFVIKSSCNVTDESRCELVGTSQLLHVQYADNAALQDNNHLNMKKKKSNMFETPGMIILAPPESSEEWVYAPTRVSMK